LATGQFDLDVHPDGRRDLARAGSWPAANRSLAVALTEVGADTRLIVGGAGHNSAQAGLDLPEALIWLWSDGPCSAGVET
jgi:enterochelin esterase family protein